MKKNYKQVTVKNSEYTGINEGTLKRVCLANISDFANPNFFRHLPKPQITKTEYGLLIYFDMQSDILGVAHLDTYGERFNHFEKIGDRIYNASLDDRLGAYIITEFLSQDKFPHDILLTVGEETGYSTAQFFSTSKQYNWIFQFDRGGTDTVLYDYTSLETRLLVEHYGWKVGQGSFSDIDFLYHLNCKGFNFGTGYYDYHGEYAYLEIFDTETSLMRFIQFYNDNKNIYLEHTPGYSYNSGWSNSVWDDSLFCPVCGGEYLLKSDNIIDQDNVYNIKKFDVCLECDSSYKYQQEKKYLDATEHYCSACKNTQICAMCDGTGKCPTGAEHKQDKCEFCTNGRCITCGGNGYCGYC